MKQMPYPKYRDSGVPWLGKVPEHWEVVRLGALLRERGETNADGRVTEVLSVLRDRGVIPYAEKGNIGNKKSEDITRYKVVRPNDIVVNCMNVIIGSVGLSRYRGCLSPVYYVLTRRAETDEPRYLNAYFQTKPFQRSLVRIGNGILAHRMRIPMELLKCEPFPRPPMDEQSAIVRFLDDAGRRIGQYIRAKRRLIELLNEQKQAIINRAVTRGLDPNVRLKPSAIGWLGDIPEHWQVRRIASFSPKITNGWVGPTRDILRDDGVPYIQSLHIKKGRIRFEKKYFVSRQWLDERPKIRLQRNDVVVVQTGDIGQVACISEEYEGAGCHALIIIRTKPAVVSGPFLDLVLRSNYGYETLRSIQTGALHPHLNCTWVREIPVPVPPTQEQDAILSYVGTLTEGLDTAIRNSETEITLIGEYRTRLIADVVTGKMDVRHLAPEGIEPSAEDLEPLEQGEDVTEDELQGSEDAEPSEEMDNADE